MSRIWKITVVVLSVAAWMSTDCADVLAQSETKKAAKPAVAAAPQGSAEKQGSAEMAQAGSGAQALPATVAMEGYCPVCIKDMKKWVKGNAAINALYQGHTYYFPGDKQKKMFEANPAKYAPAMGGECTVCKVEMGMKVPGNIRFGLLHKDQLYFFENAQQKAMFAANPTKYEVAIAAGSDTKAAAAAAGSDTKAAPAAAGSDSKAAAPAAAGSDSKATAAGSDTTVSAGSAVAFEGYCAVCLKDMKKWVPGSTEFQVTHQGQTFLFPAEKQKQMFLANPAKYAPVLGGDCAVCRVEMNQSVKGNIRFSMYHKGQLYLFPGEKQMAMFKTNPEKYEVPAADQAPIR